MQYSHEQSNADLPLLSVARRLVSTPEPDPHIIRNLRDSLTSVYRDIIVAYAACRQRSGITQEALLAFPIEEIIERLEAVAGTLTVMDYPSGLISWIDQCRNLADNLVGSADECFTIVQRMEHLRHTTKGYRSCLQTLVRSLKILQTDTTKLRQLFTNYLNSRNDLTEQHVITFDVWNAGRLSGLREAADLVQEAIYAYNCQPDNAALETITQLLHVLRTRANQASG